MKIYEADFEREREAREKTVKKLGDAHERIGELQKKVDALERGKRALQKELNQQAQGHLKDYSDEVRRGCGLLVDINMLLIALQEYSLPSPDQHRMPMPGYAAARDPHGGHYHNN
jgi:seryl-tRNA synthetase